MQNYVKPPTPAKTLHLNYRLLRKERESYIHKLLKVQLNQLAQLRQNLQLLRLRELAGVQLQV